MTDESVFAAALAIGSPTERAAYLDRACAGNPALRREVEDLLAAHAASNPLDRPPADFVRTGPYAPSGGANGPADPSGRIGPYKLLERIGEGGMGEVWVAEQHEPIKRRVALKLIKPGMDSRPVLARFEAERQALALMDHPNIAKVLDAGTTPDGRPYFVMELVKGVPITEFCDARRLTPEARLGLFVPVCQAVQHAHMKGVIHRDLKPSNVLVALHDEAPVPKVIDFGVAKAVGRSLTEKTLYTGFGALVGTPAYMAPEQATFNQLDVDTRADVYALGVLLYELLAGSPPLEPERLRRAALDEVLRIVRDEEPARPSQRLSTSQARASIAATRRSDPARLARLMRGELDWIVMKALEKDRARRYETATALALDVQRYLGGDTVEACPPTPGYRLRKAYRRNRRLLLTGAAFAAVLVVATAVSLGLAAVARRHEREAREAEAAAARERERAAGERARAQAAADEANAVIAFFADTVFLSPGDRPAGGRPGEPTLRETLLWAGDRVDRWFPGKPTAEAAVRFYLGSRLLLLGETAAAVRHLERAYALRRAAHGLDHERTEEAAFSLGTALFSAGDYGRAIRLVDEVRSRRGPGRSGRLAGLLVMLYDASGQPAKAAELRAGAGTGVPTPPREAGR